MVRIMASAASSPWCASAKSARHASVVAHAVCAVDDGAVVDEHLVDGWGGAVAFQTADVAAVAGFAVDVDGDVADFGGGAEGAVDDASVVDDAGPTPSPTR